MNASFSGLKVVRNHYQWYSSQKKQKTDGEKHGMNWTVLNFGQNAGKTLPEVIFLDPDWFFWLCEGGHSIGGGYRGNNPNLKREFDEIYIKSRNIKIPGNDNGKEEVRYYIDPDPEIETRGFITIDICVKGGRNYSEDARDPYIAKDVIDFKTPRELMPDDDYGYELFLRKIKNILFGALLIPVTMTRERCEDFFENPDNFAISDEDVEAFINNPNQRY